jgi:predicted SprT family Zn-dependent metalloprotease
MGRYIYTCAVCHQQIQEKTALDNTAPVPHKLCASCAEKAKEEEREHPLIEEARRNKAKH